MPVLSTNHRTKHWIITQSKVWFLDFLCGLSRHLWFPGLLCWPFFLPLFSSSRDRWCLLVQQGVWHQFQGSLSVGHNSLNSLQLIFDWVNGGVLCHDVTVIRGVWSTHTSLQRERGGRWSFSWQLVYSPGFNTKITAIRLTSRGGTGIPGRLIKGGGAILRLCSPQYICSSSILLQYISSSYRLQEKDVLL